MIRRTCPNEPAVSLIHVAKTLPIFVASLSVACGSDNTTAPPPSPPPTVAQVEVIPGSGELDLKGDTVQLTATARDGNGNAMSGKTFSWSSSAAAVVTVTSAGLVTAVDNGSATIRATVDGVTGEASFTVAGIGPQDLEGGVEQFVTAALGDTLVTGNGIVAVIPPGALPADTTIKIVPVPAMAALGAGVTAVRFEPDGLILNSPIQVSFPLPPEWTAANNPLVLGFVRNDPREALSTDTYAEVTGSPGNLRAVVLVSHFSGVTCAENCHAGTIHHLLKDFESRGCSKAKAIEFVTKNSEYLKDEYGEDFEKCGAIKNDESKFKVQGLLDMYFDELGTFNEDEDIEEPIADLIKFTKLGRKVVIAFTRGQWEDRDPHHNFYETFMHTAALEVVNGEVMIRNSLALTGGSVKDNPFTALLNSLDEEDLDPSVCEGNPNWSPTEKCVDRVLRYPLYDKSGKKNINVFRKMASGEAVERHFCPNGEPGCLGKDKGGSYPEWKDREGNPPWSAAKIYIEKMSQAEIASLLEPGGMPPNPCVAAAAGEGTVQGRVVHGATTDGIQGATVIAMQNGFSEGFATTGADGAYTMELRSGMYELQVDANGFTGARHGPTEVRKDDTTVVDIALTPKEAVFTGTFTITEEDEDLDDCNVAPRHPASSGQLTITLWKELGSQTVHHLEFSGEGVDDRKGVGCYLISDVNWSVEYSGSTLVPHISKPNEPNFVGVLVEGTDESRVSFEGWANWHEIIDYENCTDLWGQDRVCYDRDIVAPVWMTFTGTVNHTTGESTGVIAVPQAVPNAKGSWGK